MIDLKYVTQSREPFFEIAKALIDPKYKVLDIGAGNGHFSNYCERTDFYLFDGNKKNIDNLLKKHPNSFYGILPNLPFKNCFFDLIHCSHVIEHLLPQEFYDTLKEINRCLKKGGYIVVSAPILSGLFYCDLSHIKPYYPDILINYMCDSEDHVLTRSKISQDYVLNRLQYRFEEVQVMESFCNLRDNLFIKGMFKFMSLLYKLGLRRYEKTGYTIILQKNNNA